MEEAKSGAGSVYEGFADVDFSWNKYAAFRPAYPRSLWDRILQFHNTHHPYYGAAHDVGAGHGVAASELAKHFSRVYVSDPVEHNLEIARSNLTSTRFKATLNESCEFEFGKKAGEDDWLPEASLDMVTMFEAIHWTDSEQTVENMARSLKSGGTMALFYYGIKPYIEIDAEADSGADIEADELWARIFATRLEAVNSKSSANVRATLLSGGGLDFVPLSPKLWKEDAIRIYTNVGDKETQSFGDWRVKPFDPAWSRVGVSELIEKAVNTKDWSKTVEVSWFTNYLDTLQLNYEELSDNSVEKLAMARIQQIIGARKVQVVWPTALIMATKR